MKPEHARPGAGVVAINHDQREVVDRVLRKARNAAYGPGQFVGQESFMSARAVLQLAERAHIRRDTSVLDVCCGVAGPGLLIARTFGCSYRGVDMSEAAVRIARARAGGLACRFDTATVPPLPPEQYDAVLLLETMLAFPDKTTLLTHIAAALHAGGRFAFTMEEGEPLSPEERTAMPDADTVWLTPLHEMLGQLEEAGLRVIWQDECTHSHRGVAQRLHDEFRRDRKNIAQEIGSDGLESLLASHQLWADWLKRGRVRKFAVIAERMNTLAPA